MQLNIYNEHTKSVNCVRWSPLSNYFASASNDNKIKLYDIRCYKSIQTINAHTNSVTSIDFHPSKKYLVSCSLDSTIKIWDLYNNLILYTLYGHEGPIYSTSFNNTGEFICSGGTDADVYLWRNNLEGNLIPENNKISGGLAYPNPKRIPKSKSKSKYKLRSKSSNKVTIAKKTINYNNNELNDYPKANYGININDNNHYYCNYNYLPNNNLNNQSNIPNMNMEAISTNIDSKEINNVNNIRNLNPCRNINDNELFISKEMTNKLILMNGLQEVTKKINNFGQRIDMIGTKLSNLNNLPNTKQYNNIDTHNINGEINNNINVNNENEKINEEYETNPEAYKEAINCYQNIIEKNDNNNPVEIFEDVNNHVEDIRQEVLQNNNQNRGELIEIYSQNENNNVEVVVNSNPHPVEGIINNLNNNNNNQ